MNVMNGSIEKTLLRTFARYDVIGPFESQVSFPCVETDAASGRKEVFLFKAIYSSEPRVDEQLYERFPLGSVGDFWFIQSGIFTDKESVKAVVAALQTANAAPNSYLSTNFPTNRRLGGCSLGFAVIAAVLGLPGNFVYTGWVNDYGKNPDFFIGPVEHTALKIAYCRANRLPIFVARKDMIEDDSTKSKSGLGRFYTVADFLDGVPFMVDVHDAIECSTISDAILLANVIFMQAAMTNSS